MDIIAIPVMKALISIINFYQLIIFVNILFSWLMIFGVFNPYNPGVLTNIFNLTRSATEPLFNSVRRFLPTLGPIDFSPIVIILLLYIIEEILSRLIINFSSMPY